MKRKLLVVLLLLLSLVVKADEGSTERWPEDIIRILETEPIAEARLLSQALEEWDGSNPYWLLTLTSGHRAVFRSEDELWGSRAELAAYRFDQLMGTGLVPPTVDCILRPQDFPGEWPWKEKERRGSLQLFVEGAKHADPETLDQLAIANSEILSFVLGRYDNHSGNLLVDPEGRAVLIDFEGSLDVQKVRYGEFPFVRRGGWAESSLSIPSGKPFPFDEPSKLVDPSLEELIEAFEPWWGQYWPQGMRSLHKLLRGIPERTIPYAVWNNRLWVQVKVQSRHPAYTAIYPEETMVALRALSKEQLPALFPEPFTKQHHRGIWERREQLLEAAGAP